MAPTMAPNLTAQGTILGTFQYMAPEQLEGQEADARTDIFAFGAVLYEMLTGKKAFDGQEPGESDRRDHARRATAGVDARSRSCPPALDRVVKKCLAKDPDDAGKRAQDLARAAVDRGRRELAVTACGRIHAQPVA